MYFIHLHKFSHLPWGCIPAYRCSRRTGGCWCKCGHSHHLKMRTHQCLRKRKRFISLKYTPLTIALALPFRLSNVLYWVCTRAQLQKTYWYHSKVLPSCWQTNFSLLITYMEPNLTSSYRKWSLVWCSNTAVDGELIPLEFHKRFNCPCIW